MHTKETLSINVHQKVCDQINSMCINHWTGLHSGYGKYLNIVLDIF